MIVAPDLRLEQSLFAAGARFIVGMDEVGRGALAGPVAVGALGVDCVADAPPGLRDSKLLTPASRERLRGSVENWAQAWAVGFASAAEVDREGIVGALRLAGLRALADLAARRPGPIDVVLLDGTHDWLTPPQLDLFDLAAGPATGPPPSAPGCDRVVTRAKADRDCATVAGASVLAKCARDAYMRELDERWPQYGWARNKGYGSLEHRAALRSQGVSPEHRVSWNLDLGDAG